MTGLTEIRMAKAIRDRSLTLVKADIQSVRGDLSFSHFKERATETAGDMADDATDIANRNKGLLAALGAALTLWFARKPIAAMAASAFGAELLDDDHDETGLRRSASR